VNLFRTATAVLALSSASVMASPMVIEFNDFSSVAGLQLNGAEFTSHYSLVKSLLFSQVSSAVKTDRPNTSFNNPYV
jgi:hypothetical protein